MSNYVNLGEDDAFEEGPTQTLLMTSESFLSKLPKKRKPSVDVLVRALAIKKLKAEDPTTSKYYEDKKATAK